MKNDHSSLKEWGERLILTVLFKKYYLFDSATLEVKDFESDGLILDIGGGGEGVIGRFRHNASPVPARTRRRSSSRAKRERDIEKKMVKRGARDS